MAEWQSKDCSSTSINNWKYFRLCSALMKSSFNISSQMSIVHMAQISPKDHCIAVIRGTIVMYCFVMPHQQQKRLLNTQLTDGSYFPTKSKNRVKMRRFINCELVFWLLKEIAPNLFNATTISPQLSRCHWRPFLCGCVLSYGRVAICELVMALRAQKNSNSNFRAF